jgi:exopolysaccharide biosynthesis polyprenyl glycosylphosphotransferase
LFLIKQLLDFLISLAGLILLLPLFGIIATAIKIDDRGPVFFCQERAGKGGSIFRIYKFRSMVVCAERKGAGVFAEENDSRITRVGKFLRHTSFDELPQLINVLKGEMSLVGPRPTLPYQVERYDARQRERLNVKPGITGWAQVNGRNTLTWPERIELDLWYVDNWSLWLDFKVLFMTFLVVLKKRGLYREIREDPISGTWEIK